MIDWDRPVYLAANGVQVYVWGRDIGPRNGDNGHRVIVQDRSGGMMRFYPCGTPIGNIHFLTNDGMHQHPVRTRLAQIIHLRALKMLGLDEEAMREHEAWGAF